MRKIKQCLHKTPKWELDEPLSMISSIWDLVCSSCKLKMGWGVKAEGVWIRTAFFEDCKAAITRAKKRKLI